MLNKFTLCLLLVAVFSIWGCTDDKYGGSLIARRFTVKIENVSQTNTINSPRADGTVPLSPGVYAVYAGENPVFMIGQTADGGTERIAEDGFPMQKDAQLSNMPAVLINAAFQSPGGLDNDRASMPHLLLQQKLATSYRFRRCLYNPMTGFMLLEKRAFRYSKALVLSVKM